MATHAAKEAVSAHDSHAERILVLDFGSQTAQLIARRVRDQHVFCQLVRHDLSPERIKELNPKGLILSGGPASVYEKGAPLPNPAIFQLGIPILGICYGMQAACRAMGCEVKPCLSREFGYTKVQSVETDPFFVGVPDSWTVWMSHGDQVQNLSSQFQVLATTDTCPNAAVRHHTLPLYGLQFHPEVTHTQFGEQLLANCVWVTSGWNCKP